MLQIEQLLKRSVLKATYDFLTRVLVSYKPVAYKKTCILIEIEKPSCVGRSIIKSQFSYCSFNLDVLFKRVYVSKLQERNYKKNYSKVVLRMLCTIRYHLYNLKKVKNTHGEVLACSVTISNTHPWVFLTFFKLYRWYQIAQPIVHIAQKMKFPIKIFFSKCDHIRRNNL